MLLRAYFSLRHFHRPSLAKLDGICSHVVGTPPAHVVAVHVPTFRPKTHGVAVGSCVVETLGLDLAGCADGPGRGPPRRKEPFQSASRAHTGRYLREHQGACDHTLRIIAIACSQRDRSARKSSNSKPDPSLHSPSKKGPGTMASPYNSRPRSGDCSSARLWSGPRRAEPQNRHLRRRETLRDRIDLQLSRSP